VQALACVFAHGRRRPPECRDEPEASARRDPPDPRATQLRRWPEAQGVPTLADGSTPAATACWRARSATITARPSTTMIVKSPATTTATRAPGWSANATDATASATALPRYLRQLLEAHRSAPEVVVAWQGGEPTLMGLDFFRRSVELIEQLKRPRQRVLNTLQKRGSRSGRRSRRSSHGSSLRRCPGPKAPSSPTSDVRRGCRPAGTVGERAPSWRAVA
jgi:hypothetical protein